ncbi:DUF1573 domain-containing protein [Candidatus Uhrbacteria bacterium]|nr:DUF1573 domain-containing protein [Candidatus Uhrbacteria bacterium]
MKKQPTYLYLGAAGLIALLVIVVISSSGASETPAAAAISDAMLTVSETRWDFGDISMASGKTTKEISLTNTSASPLTITQMQTSCMCTTAQIVHADGSKSASKGMVGHGGGSAALSETISAGETATLEVTFDPNAHGPEATGPITRMVMLGTNSQAQPEIELTFSGNVTK